MTSVSTQSGFHIEAEAPVLEILSKSHMSEGARENWRLSGLQQFCSSVEEWTSGASTHAMRYATHGLFRYFGKFPPIIPRYLINHFTAPGDLIIDPMIGSGTTAVESLLLKRGCAGADVSPLSELITRVKTTRTSREATTASLNCVCSRLDAVKYNDKTNVLKPTGFNVDHFFLPETSFWLRHILTEIEKVACSTTRALLLASYASIIRKVSKATSQQGRPFLDVESAVPDPRAAFRKQALQAIEQTCALPERAEPITVTTAPAHTIKYAHSKVPLIICHPPYFNGYRYSSIFAFELGWLGFPRKSVAKQEVREFFKVGKAENVGKYVAGMEEVLRHCQPYLQRDGVLALMIGDTNIRGERVLATRQLLQQVSDCLKPIKVAIRTPRFTEASWVASQRRSAEKVGIRILDYVVLLKPTT